MMAEVRRLAKRAVEKTAQKVHSSVSVRLPALKKPLLLFGHEMKKSGASILVVHLANFYAESGYDVVLVVPDGVPMEEAALASLDKRVLLHPLFPGTKRCRSLIEQLVQQGCTHCIANTVVTGIFAKDLADFGVQTTWLIHEMSCSCRMLHAQTMMEDIRKTAKAIVFPARIVRDQFREMCGSDFLCPTPIMPQGVYKALSRPARSKEEIREELEREMCVPKDAVLLTGAGVVTFGKGCDMLVPVLNKFRNAGGKKYHVLWLGGTQGEEAYVIWLRSQIKAAGLEECWTWAGFVNDNAKYAELISASDVFVLPSREDSYPSVMLEAQFLRVPVLAFEGSGGGEDISRSQHGRAAKMGDIDDFCSLVEWLSEGSAALCESIEQCALRLQKEAGFAKYAREIAEVAHNEG